MTLATGLHLVGYPVAIGVIARFVPVVRERRLAWFLAHQAAVAAIAAGWLLKDRPSAVAVNGAWGVIAAGWYLSRSRRV